VRLVPHRRVSRVLGTAIQRRTDGWRSISLRAYVVSAGGMAFDGRVSPLGLFGPGAEREHSYITIPLEGEFISLRGSSAGVIVRPSVALIENSITWEERWERELRALVIQWSSEHGQPVAGELQLAPADLEHARVLADRICSPCDEDPWPLLVPFLERLRALGVGLVSAEQIDLPDAPPEVVRIERAMSALLMELERAPGSVDLSSLTGLSERHLRRLFEQHQLWLGAFRERVRHARLPSAANWLAFSDLSTERVARSLGYGSARALVRALDDAGYGGREEIRRRVR
jgi:AraC-like DNA-binding protein